MVPFTVYDDPFDGKFDRPFFGVYGINEAHELEHIADRDKYSSAVELTTKLAPGIHFAQEVRRSTKLSLRK